MKGKKLGIITIIDRNLGNRLQNYALQEFLRNKGFDVSTIGWRKFDRTKIFIKSLIKTVYLKIIKKKSYNYTWDIFDLNIRWSDLVIPYETVELKKNIKEKFDYFVVGSDQVWNPNFYYYVPRAFLGYADDSQKIAFSASFGVSQIPPEYIDEYAKNLVLFKNISVREDAGAEIVRELTGKKAEVLLDPTMLISVDEWRKISKKSKYKPGKKFIIKYFLGERLKDYDKFIERKANELGADIIDILNSEKTWIIGPAEFVYLFEHAEAAFVDSFHGSVFSIIFGKPFAVFDRVGTKGTGNMNSRIDTLLKTFMLEDHRISDINELEKLNMTTDLEKITKILDNKRKEASDFAEKAFE